MKWMLVVLVGGVTPVNTDLATTNSPNAFPPRSRCESTTPTRSRPGIDGPQPTSNADGSIRRHVIVQAKRLLSNSVLCPAWRRRSAVCRTSPAARDRPCAVALRVASFANAAASPETLPRRTPGLEGISAAVIRPARTESDVGSLPLRNGYAFWPFDMHNKCYRYELLVSVLLVEDDPLIRELVVESAAGGRLSRDPREHWRGGAGLVQSSRRGRAGHRRQAAWTGRWVADRGTLPRAGSRFAGHLRNWLLTRHTPPRPRKPHREEAFQSGADRPDNQGARRGKGVAVGLAALLVAEFFTSLPWPAPDPSVRRAAVA